MAKPEESLPGNGLQANAHWLEHAVDHSAAALYIKDAAGLYRYLNHGWEFITGRPRERMIGIADPQIFDDPSARSRHAADLQVIGSGQGREGEEVFGDKVLLSKRTPLIENGRIIGVCNVATDISERKAMEERLRLSESRFRNLFQASADAVMLLDRDQFLDCNPSTLKIFGCRSEAEFLGKHPSELSPPMQPGGLSSRDLADERIRVAFETGRNFFEWTHLRVDTGECFPAEVLLNTVEVGGALILQAVVRDVSERKKAEEALRHAKDLAETATRMKSNFLANMSHELRTPLNAILGFTGTLLMRLPGDLNNEQEHQLTTIRSSARHLLDLINDLLDLARIEAGRMELKPETIDCTRLLIDLVETLRPLTERKNLQLDLQLPGQPAMIESDLRALKQIVLNLAHNAIKFTEQGGVTISLRRIDDGGRPAHEIVVADTGIGIREEDRERLFQAFSQVDSVSDGTGLGLHLSQRFAQLIGGRIEFESHYGKGSRFALIMPAGASLTTPSVSPGS